MTDLNLFAVGTAAFVGSWITLAAVAETTPIVNDEGQEEYSVKGYMILASYAAVRWCYEKVLGLFGYEFENVSHDETETTDDDSNEYELII